MTNKHVLEGFRLVLGKLLVNSCTKCVKLARVVMYEQNLQKSLLRTSFSLVLVGLT